MVIKKKVREFVHAANFRISKDALPALEEVTRIVLRKAMSYSKPYKNGSIGGDLLGASAD